MQIYLEESISLQKWLSVWIVSFVMVWVWGIHLSEVHADSAQQQSAKQVLEKTIALAKKGYAINTEKEKIKLGSTALEVKKKFGQPDHQDSPTYYVYSKKRLEFLLEETAGIPDNQRKVVSIGTTDQRYDNITYQQVQAALEGYQKVSETKGEDAVYVTYRVGSNFLTFDFYYDHEGQNPDTIKQVHVQKKSSL